MGFFPIEKVYWLLDFNFCLIGQTAFRIIRCIIHRYCFQKWVYSNPRSPRLPLNWIATLFGNFDQSKNRTYKTYIIISRVPLVAIFAFISTDDSKSWVDVNLWFRIIKIWRPRPLARLNIVHTLHLQRLVVNRLFARKAIVLIRRLVKGWE